jgi:hypothetical protein
MGRERGMAGERRRVWIVEANFINSTAGWHPTVGIGLSRMEGRQRLREWRRQNPYDRFRVRKYQTPGVRRAR